MRPATRSMLAGSIVLLATLASAVAHEGDHLRGIPAMMADFTKLNAALMEAMKSRK